jgi:hypothetical protein
MSRPSPSAIGRAAWITGLTGMVALLIAAYFDCKPVLQSYLFVWWFLLGIPLGSMAILMVHNLTGGAWGEFTRPALESAMSLLPTSLVMSIPLWFGLPSLYVWAQPDAVNESALLQAKAWYLNSGFFSVRSAICFATWLGLAHMLRRYSSARNSDPASPAAQRLRALSALGLLLYVPTVTVAAVDWIMSLNPQWYSSSFGLLAVLGQGLAAFACAIAAAAWLRQGRHPGMEVPAVFQDLGNLLLMFVMTWTYLAFTQYLITWAENLPDEITWYLPRVETSWRLAALFLVAFHFAIPFLVLLSRQAKRAPRILGTLALGLLFAHLIDAFWMVIPTFRPNGFTLAWSDLFAAAALLGIWLAQFAKRIESQPLSDPLPATEELARHA